MVKKMALVQAVEEFRWRWPRCVGVSDHEGLKTLYSECVAAARLGSGREEQMEVNWIMQEALREAFLAPSKHVRRRNVFDDL